MLSTYNIFLQKYYIGGRQRLIGHWWRFALDIFCLIRYNIEKGGKTSPLHTHREDIMKNYVIAIEPIFRHEDDTSEPGYVKCYQLGGRWTWKSVGTSAQASKFTLQTANWKSKQMQASNGCGQVLFYPVEI